MSLQVFGTAFSLMASSMVGVGPQNTLLLRQGLARSHVAHVILICVLGDVLLVGLGVFGLGQVLRQWPMLLAGLSWLGGGLMLWLAASSFRSACRPAAMLLTPGAMACRTRVRRQALLVTLGNPLVWMDSVVLMGSMSALHTADSHLWFALGAIAASLLWFVGVGLGARWLAPLFQRPLCWRVLDLMIGGVMLSLALGLLQRLL